MDKQTDFDIGFIGAGIVGLSAAYEISKKYPDVSIGIFEKEGQTASGQTGRNSGVIHSGLYYKPGSYKAVNCIKGRKLLVEFARDNNIEHNICGKVIAATSQNEIARMDQLFQNGLVNGIEGIERIDEKQVRDIEPYCGAIGGIYVPCTGIIDFRRVAEKLAELVEKSNPANAVICGCEVKKINKTASVRELTTNRGQFRVKYLINCAGLFCDRLARMDGLRPSMRIIPFRGDYFELAESAGTMVKNLIYPVPDPKFPFLGVHFTRMINGVVECGPNAVFSFKREGYSRCDFNFKDTVQSLGYPGTWIMFAKNWKYGLAEYIRALSKKVLIKQLRRLMPDLKLQDIRYSRSAVRAQALGSTGRLIDDFLIEKGENCIHVLNAPSPAATACLAIGQQICDQAAVHFGL